MQFKFGYLLRHARLAPTAEAVLGTCVHRALEEVYLARMRGRLLSEAETLSIFEREWVRAFATDRRGPPLDPPGPGRAAARGVRQAHDDRFSRGFGGSSLIATLAGIGILLNISRKGSAIPV